MEGVLAVGVVLGLRLVDREAERVAVEVQGRRVGDTDVQRDVVRREGLGHGAFCSYTLGRMDGERVRTRMLIFSSME